MNPKLKGYALLALVFALGAIAGAGLNHRFVEHGGRFGDEDREHEWRLRALANQLDLTADQRKAIRGIMRQRREQGRGVLQHTMEVCGEALRAYKADTDAQIRSVLNAEQKPRFDALLSKQRERFPMGWPGMRHPPPSAAP